jgi:hypothetical protein
MEMAMKAIDVVLLPNKEMTDLVIEANRGLLVDGSGKIVLGRSEFVPHISVAMGCVDSERISVIGEKLSEVWGSSGGNWAKNLKAVGVTVVSNKVGEKVSSFVVAKSMDLQLFHEAIMHALADEVSYEVNEDMLASESVSATTLEWIRYFRNYSSFEHYMPHITIGYGQVSDLYGVIDFSAITLGVYWLGDHCTCNKPLWVQDI